MSFVVAEQLEARLEDVNEQLGLRQRSGDPEAWRKDGEQTEELVKKCETEKVRRGHVLTPLQRISYLFKAPPKLWTKKEVMCLGKTIFHVCEWNWLLTNFISG